MKKVPCAGCGELRWPSAHTGAPARPTCQKCRANLTHGKASTYKKRGCRCDLCRAAWAAYNSKYAHARRATIRGLEAAELVDPAAIYERDGWTCGICELPVDPAERFPSPGAATLDHVIPISRGGTHAPGNLQCAHFYCNSVKGSRSQEEAC